MSRTGDQAVRLIEHIFQLRRKIELAVIELKEGVGTCTFTGGPSTGHCRIPDPTAIQAIRNAVELDFVQLENGYRVLYPEKWLRVYYAVRDFCEADPVDKEIFSRRYDRGDFGVPYTIEQSVYSRHLLKIRNHAKICAAQEQLIKFF